MKIAIAAMAKTGRGNDMIEVAEALEKYTVVQLIAALPLMFVIWLIIREVNGVVRGGKPAQAGNVNAISNMAQAVVEISSNNKATATVLERIMPLIIESNDKADANKTVIGELTSKQEKANKVVTNMSNTVDEQAKDTKAILAAIEKLDAKVSAIGSKFDILGVEIQDTKTELSNIKEDVIRWKPTQETPQVDIQKTLVASAAASHDPQSTDVTPEGAKEKTE